MNQPGQYQCVVTLNDHVAKSQVIAIVEENNSTCFPDSGGVSINQASNSCLLSDTVIEGKTGI